MIYHISSLSYTRVTGSVSIHNLRTVATCYGELLALLVYHMKFLFFFLAEALKKNTVCPVVKKWSRQISKYMFLFEQSYLFIGPLRGQNFVHSLHLKRVPTFLVPFLLLPNSSVRIYVDSTKIMSVRQNGGKAKQLPKLVIMGCDGLTSWSAGGGSLVPAPW